MATRLKNSSVAFAAAWLAILPGAPAHAVNAISDTPKPTGVWLLWVISVVIFGAVTAITFKNAKRSHQD